MAVKIRLKKMGRRHRPFFRICVMDARTARDGRVLEELGTYDPMVPETDARVKMNAERVAYWLSVGAQPTDKTAVLIKKYGPNGTHLEAQQKAVEKIAQQQRSRGEIPAYTPRPEAPKRQQPPRKGAASAEATPEVQETAAVEQPVAEAVDQVLEQAAEQTIEQATEASPEQAPE